MKKWTTVFLIFALLAMGAILFRVLSRSMTPQNSSTQKTASMQAYDHSSAQPGELLDLPAPLENSGMGLEEALRNRRSVRSYSEDPITIQQLSQLLWAAQGITTERGFRTAPSAGATFPLEIFVAVNQMNELSTGLYHYLPHENKLTFLRSEDLSMPLYQACLSQSMLLDASVTIIFAAFTERTTSRYGERGMRFIHNEVGHASQNVHLQAAALDLGTVVIGAYRDEEVENILQLDGSPRVLYLMPIGSL